MPHDNVTKELTTAQLYDLLLEANTKQTQELKSEIQSATQNLTEKIERANEEIKKLKLKNLLLERKNRKNNIVIFGLETNNDNLLMHTISTLNELLGTNIRENDINNLYKLKNVGKPPVIVEFVTYLKKIYAVRG